MINIYLGWIDLSIGEDGLPMDEFTGWKASCFVLFTRVIYIGEVVEDELKGER